MISHVLMVYSIRDASRQGSLAVQGKEDDGGVEESQGTFVIGLNRRAEDFTNTWQHHLTSPSIFTQPNVFIIFESQVIGHYMGNYPAVTIQDFSLAKELFNRCHLARIAKIARMVKIARIV